MVEGLEQAKELRELHIENQRLIEGEKLLFDPRSLRAIKVRNILMELVYIHIILVQASLTVLNVSGNRIDTVEDLQCLVELVTFIASDNDITNMKVSLMCVD